MPAGPKSRKRADTKPAGAARLPARLLAPLAQRPIESGCCAVFAALLTGILLNALALQNARHPSPLFGTPVSLVLAEAPRPVPRPVPTSASPAPTQPTLPIAIPTRPVAIPRDAEAAPTKAADAIGDMLRGAPASSSGAASTNPSAIEATRILLVQKALMKLGYVVRPDGVIGATTRQAIEKFERERGWPVHGELTPKVLREISARSGLSLE
jgi:Putative peptidoglycan binding domain